MLIAVKITNGRHKEIIIVKDQDYIVSVEILMVLGNFIYVAISIRDIDGY